MWSSNSKGLISNFEVPISRCVIGIQEWENEWNQYLIVKNFIVLCLIIWKYVLVFFLKLSIITKSLIVKNYFIQEWMILTITVKFFSQKISAHEVFDKMQEWNLIFHSSFFLIFLMHMKCLWNAGIKSTSFIHISIIGFKNLEYNVWN